MIKECYERPVDWEAPESSDPVWQELDWMVDDPKLFALYEHDLRAYYRAARRGAIPSRWRSAIE